MDAQGRVRNWPQGIRFYMLMLMAAWTLVLAGTAGWSFRQEWTGAYELARVQGRNAIQKDLAYRLWVSNRGGVFAPVSEETPPNPYLSGIPNHDITLPSGLHLTLVNPAYMTRQVHELAFKQYGDRGHLTSLKTIRPENAPDLWETKALQTFDAGKTEASSIEVIDGQPYMRLMRPLLTSESCLRCHASQGYKVDDVRGGISVSVPMREFSAKAKSQVASTMSVFVLVWLIGLAGIGTGARKVAAQVTETVRYKDALSESEERLQLALSGAELGMWDWHLDNNILYTNEVWQTMLGYDPKEELGDFSEMWRLRLHPNDIESTQALIEEHLGGGSKFYRSEHRVRCKDSTYKWVLDIGRITERNAEGKPTRMVGIRMDIDPLRQMQDALVEARDAAEGANRAKSAFLANLSHEIRTPMNAILGFSQLMERDPGLTGTQKGHLKAILRSGEHLLCLINDVLEMSKIEAGRMTLNPGSFDLHALLDDIEMMFRIRTDAKGLTLLFERTGDLPRYVLADESKVRQILINLLGNSVKFTECGGIAARAGVRSGHNRKRCLIIEVEDTGAGIREEEMSKLFEAFGQTESGIKSQGGTGLGLAISRKYARLMGGDITVQSEYGRGSNFRVELDIEEGSLEEVKAKQEPRTIIGLAKGQETVRILVAEDQDASRRLLEGLLQQAGFNVCAVGNGREAVEAFHTWAPDMVLMDINMPEMDGLQAMKAIKATEKGAQVPIVAVSASAFTEARADILASGFDDFMAKPFRTTEILEMIGSYLGIEYIYEEQPDPSAAPTPTRLTSESISGLPAELIAEMLDAIGSGYINRLTRLIDQVEHHNVETARGLRLLAENFDYDGLRGILEKNTE